MQLSMRLWPHQPSAHHQCSKASQDSQGYSIHCCAGRMLLVVRALMHRTHHPTQPLHDRLHTFNRPCMES